MSRIGKRPIPVPKGVDIKLEGGVVKVKGPKGLLELKLHPSMDLKIESGVAKIVPKSDTKFNRKFHGLSRTLVANMVEGVANNFTKSLTLVGVGFRGAMKGKDLNLTIGYSHPVDFVPPKGIEIKVDKQTTIVVTGPDKELVGRVSATIRSFRLPEPYHGKGIRYENEVIVTKVGKSGSKTAS
jgi:large subunit ribosomal protein L6